MTLYHELLQRQPCSDPQLVVEAIAQLVGARSYEIAVNPQKRCKAHLELPARGRVRQETLERVRE